MIDNVTADKQKKPCHLQAAILKVKTFIVLKPFLD